MGKKLLCVFVLLLLGSGIAIASTRSNLIVSDVQIGYEDNKTRISLILSKPIPLYARLSADTNMVAVESPEDTIWNIPSTVDNPQGNFKKYELSDITEIPRTLRIYFNPITTIVGSTLQKSQKGQHQFVIDLITQELPPSEPEPEPISQPLPPAQESLPPPMVINPVIELLPPPKNAVKTIQVLDQKNGNTWIVVTSAFREYFNFEQIDQDRKIIVYVPKTNWMDVNTKDKSSDLIRTYRVQDTEPNIAAIHFDAYKTVGIIDQFMSPNSDGSNDFVLVIADRMPTEEESNILQQKKEMEKENRLKQEQQVMQSNIATAVMQKIKQGNTPLPENPMLDIPPDATTFSTPMPTSDPLMSAEQLKEKNEGMPPATEILSDADPLFDTEAVSSANQQENNTVDSQAEPAWVTQARKEAQVFPTQ